MAAKPTSPGTKKKSTSTRASSSSSSSSSSSKKKTKTKAAATPRSYHHGDLFRALIDAAKAELHDVGADALSLRGVARRAGVSHAAPYHHFADKDLLMAHLAKEGFVVFAGALRRGGESVTADAARDPGDVGAGGVAGARLRAIGAAYLRFAREEPALFAVITGGCSDAHREVWQEAASAAFAVLVDAVTAVRVAAGLDEDAGTDSAADDAMLHWGVVHGLAKLEAENGIGAAVDVDALWTRMSLRLTALYAAASGAGGIDAVGTRPR